MNNSEMDPDELAVLHAVILGIHRIPFRFRFQGSEGTLTMVDTEPLGHRVHLRCSRLGWWWRIRFYEAMFTVCRWPFFRWVVRLGKR